MTRTIEEIKNKIKSIERTRFVETSVPDCNMDRTAMLAAAAMALMWVVDELEDIEI